MYQKQLDAVIQAWNTGNVDLLDDVVDNNIVRTAPEAITRNISDLKQFKTLITDFRKAFPDMKVTVKETYFSDGHGTIKWNFQGTNTGPGEMPPTNKAVDITGVSLAKYENEKLVREELYFDALEMLSQLGHLSVPKAASA